METKVLFYGAYFNKTSIKMNHLNKQNTSIIIEPTTRRPKRDVTWIEEDKQDEDLPYSVIRVNDTKYKHDLVNESEFELNYNMGIAYIVAVAVCLIISFIKIVRK